LIFVSSAKLSIVFSVRQFNKHLIIITIMVKVGTVIIGQNVVNVVVAV